MYRFNIVTAKKKKKKIVAANLWLYSIFCLLPILFPALFQAFYIVGALNKKLFNRQMPMVLQIERSREARLLTSEMLGCF